MSGVSITALIKKMNLRLLNNQINTDKIKLIHPDINRPALQLSGFYDHFDNERVQIIGHVEYAYISQMDSQLRVEMYEKLLSSKIPCIVYSSSMEPDETFLEIATGYGVPVMVSEKATSVLMAEIIRWLNVELAPTISIHGVLVDVYGEGVLIMGESGIGKSEAALELIKRGHRLVSDDVVEIRRVSDDTLVGSAPGITRISLSCAASASLMSRLCLVWRVSKIPNPLTWLSSWRIGAKIRNMIGWAWRNSTQNFWEIKWCATRFPSDRAVTWPSSLNRLL